MKSPVSSGSGLLFAPLPRVPSYGSRPSSKVAGAQSSGAKKKWAAKRKGSGAAREYFDLFSGESLGAWPLSEAIKAPSVPDGAVLLAGGAAVGSGRQPAGERLPAPSLFRVSSDGRARAMSPRRAGAPGGRARAGSAHSATSSGKLQRSVSDPRDEHWAVDPDLWHQGIGVNYSKQGKRGTFMRFPPFQSVPHAADAERPSTSVRLHGAYAVVSTMHDRMSIESALKDGVTFPTDAALKAAMQAAAEPPCAADDPKWRSCPAWFAGAQNKLVLTKAAPSAKPKAPQRDDHRPTLKDAQRFEDAMIAVHELLLAEADEGGGPGTILHDPNAGGASENSEALSAFMLEHSYGASFARSETSVKYLGQSSIVDFVCRFETHRVGVSVTRAMKWAGGRPQPALFTSDDALVLLNKKLRGLRMASEAVQYEHAWSRRILHIWADTQHIADVIFAVLQHSIAATIAERGAAHLLPGPAATSLASSARDPTTAARLGGPTSTAGPESDHSASHKHGKCVQGAAPGAKGRASRPPPRHRADIPSWGPHLDAALLKDTFVLVSTCLPRSVLYSVVFGNSGSWDPLDHLPSATPARRT